MTSYYVPGEKLCNTIATHLFIHGTNISQISSMENYDIILMKFYLYKRSLTIVPTSCRTCKCLFSLIIPIGYKTIE